MPLTGAASTRRDFLATAGGLGGLGIHAARAASKKKIAFVAGPKSHGFGQHDHNAGCLLLARYLNENVSGVEAVVHRDGWPDDAAFLNGASAVVLYADGGEKNPILPHMDQVQTLMDRGVGLAVLHYALIVPKGKPGQRFIDWIGGYYETYWSVNPVWSARFDQLPTHPITRGVKPFAIRDEWYYHMRFREKMAGVTPILTAIPPDETRERKFGPHSGNPVVRSRKGMAEHVAWACERPDGGRGFGFAGGHFHWAWGHDDVRRLMLNAFVWIAGLEVPDGGIASPTPTWNQLLANLEGEMPDGFTKEQAREAIRPVA